MSPLISIFLVGLLVNGLLGAFIPSTTEDNEISAEYGEYLEGDIMVAMERNGQIKPTYRWNNNRVPYVIDPVFTPENVALIEKAFEDFAKFTCVRMVPKEAEDKDYISIESGGGCSSYVGRIGGKQRMSLKQGSPGCVFANKLGIVHHETMHALGFYHEQARSDRDCHVDIKWDNIQKGKEGNFNRKTTSQVTDFNIVYDYASLLHYGGKSFAIDSNHPTIVTKDPSFQSVIGQRQHMSKSDIYKINVMYNCTEHLQNLEEHPLKPDGHDCPTEEKESPVKRERRSIKKRPKHTQPERRLPSDLFSSIKQ